MNLSVTWHLRLGSIGVDICWYSELRTDLDVESYVDVIWGFAGAVKLGLVKCGYLESVVLASHLGFRLEFSIKNILIIVYH